MDRIEEFVDTRQKTWCIHCTRPLAGTETNEDHVPTKSLLRKPRPHHLPVVTICRECNNGFSRDEQYAVTFLSCVLAGTADPDSQPNASAARALIESPALRTRIEQSRTDFVTEDGETQTVWTPELARIERVILKNARGHAYFEYGEPMLDAPAKVWTYPLQALTPAQRDEFEGLNHAGVLAAWPEVGSRMMSRVITGQDMKAAWVVVQDGVYRYAVDQQGGIRVRSVLYEYLATEVLWQD